MKESRSLRRCLGACVALLLTLASLVAACGGSPAQTQPTVYRLKLSSHIPAQAPPARALEEWTQKVEQATGGRVQFTIYPAETLAKGREALQATEDGVCDVAIINLAYVAKQWSLNSVVTLGSIVFPRDRGTEIWGQLLQRFPQMAAEMSGVKILGKSVATSTSLHVKGREVRVPADLKGLRIAALGDSAFLMQAAGAVFFLDQEQIVVVVGALRAQEAGTIAI